MFKKILIGLGLLVVLVLATAYFQPTEYSVSRSVTIKASTHHVFRHVNDFHQWETWSPWAKLDPTSKVVFDGPAEGTGSIFSWSGNSKVGEGSMTILESVPGEKIVIRLDFVRPFKDTATSEFAFKTVEGGTDVTWTMHGERNYIGKVVCLIMGMDRMIGGDFERGLASLKATTEASFSP